MNRFEKKIRILRLTVIILSLVGILSSLPMLVTMFAYGVGEDKSMFLFLPSLIILGMAVILPILKKNTGYYLGIFSSTILSFLLMGNVLDFLFSDFRETELLSILLLPFTLFIMLIFTFAFCLSQNRATHNDQ